MKVGISGQPLNKNGTSPRANKQVNALNQNQPGRYRAVIVEKNQSRTQAKALEQQVNSSFIGRVGGCKSKCFVKNKYLSTKKVLAKIFLHMPKG